MAVYKQFRINCFTLLPNYKYIYILIQASLAESKTGFIIDERIAGYVLSQSEAYAYFQMFESILIIFISIVQVMFVARILKNDSIVV